LLDFAPTLFTPITKEVMHWTMATSDREAFADGGGDVGFGMHDSALQLLAFG
jgi:hypothetical protein